MSTTEERIAAALSAYSGGITMDTSTMEKRFAEVREQGARDRRRRRGIAVGAAALATAAALVAAFTLGGGIFDGEDRVTPPTANTPDEPPAPARGEAFPEGGKSYSVTDFVVPFTFTVPDKGDVPGKWRYAIEATRVTVGLDTSVATGHANLVLAEVSEVYDPQQLDLPADQRQLVPAPQDADGWVQWLEQTGLAEVTDRAELEVDGSAATRLSLDVSADIPPSAFPCAPGESCLAFGPEGPSVVGADSTQPFTSELTVLQVDGRTLVVAALGATPTQERWLPLLQSVVSSLQF